MSLFNSSFPKEIKNSLEKRQEAMTNRTPQNLQYLNSRNAWIRMTSAVDINDSSNLAQNYVLQGGTLNPNETLKSGIGTGKEAYSTKSPGGTSHRLGIRPIPGITSIEVQSKSMYGSLREVTVEFQCWDIHQLEDLELLYMRSGYTALIEWGWVPYINQNGTYVSTFTDFLGDELLKPKNDINIATIPSKIYSRCLKTGGNYDAVYGYIKNYQWSARPDGGYDCRTTLVSVGEIVESIKVNYVRADLSKYGMYDTGSIGSGFLDELFVKQGNNPSVKFADYYQKNTLAGIWAELNFKLKDPNAKVLTNKGKTYLENKYSVLDVKGLTRFGDFNQFIEPGSGIKTYITLEAALDIMNEYIIARSEIDDNPLIKFSIKTPTYVGGSTEDLLCVAHPIQVSVDPTSCLIKNPLWYKDIVKEIGGATTQTSTQLAATANTVVKSLIEAAEGAGVDGDSFTAAIKNIITTSVEYFAVNKDLAEGTTSQALGKGDKWKYAPGNTNGEGLVGLLTEQFITNPPGIKQIDRINGVNRIASGKLNALYRLYDIQQHLKSKGVNIEINLTVTVNNQPEQKTLTALLNNRPVEPFFLNFNNDIVKLLNGEYILNNITVNSISAAASSAAATAAATFVLSTEDAVSSIKILENLEKSFFYKDNPKKELGVIGNIYVSLDLLYRQSLNQGLEASDSKEKNEISLYNYVKSIMSEIQTSLGNVNSFEVHVDPIDNIARVIDVKYTSPSKPSDLFKLEVQNLNSIIRSYSLESQIFPNQSSLIVMGSQKKSGRLGVQSGTLNDFNDTLTDRIIPEKEDTGDSVAYNDPNNPALANSLAGVTILFGTLGKAPLDNSPNTANISELVSKAKNALRDLIVYFQALLASPGKNRDIIPVKFGFEMDGIGGLLIGSLFETDKDLIPKGYNTAGTGGTKIAHTVTRLSHVVSKEDWTTKIEALNVILNRPEEGAFNSSNITKIVKIAIENIISAGVGVQPQPPAPAAYNQGTFVGGGGDITPGDSTDFDLFFYLAWQQGQSGAAQHYSLWKRNGKYTKYSISAKNIYQNWPGASGTKTGNPKGGYKSAKGYDAGNVINLYNTNQNELAEAFVDVQRQLYKKKTTNAASLINSTGTNKSGVPYSEIKAAFQKHQRPNEGVSATTLANFGMIENGLDTSTSSSGTYQTMFQMNKGFDNFAKIIKNLTKTNTTRDGVAFIKYDTVDSLVQQAVPIMIETFNEFKQKSGFA